MTLLIISPDYASHLYPLAALGSSWLEAGERVVVATGPATASIVRSFGYEHVSLQLSRGSNPGIIRAEEQPDGEDDALRGFFAATREGMIQTLSFQAEARLNDLMWEPVATARAVQAIVEDLNPTTIMVDHLAYSARLALVAAGIDYVDVVLGHPTALPMTAAGEVYGLPPAWPSAFSPSEQVVYLRMEHCLGRIGAEPRALSERVCRARRSPRLQLPGGTHAARSFGAPSGAPVHWCVRACRDARTSHRRMAVRH